MTITADRLFPVGVVVEDDRNEWYTPAWLFEALGLTFDLDVCSPVDRSLVSTPARAFLTPLDDGLTSPWHGLVWCNPPYSDAGPWARRMVEHGDGLLLSHVPINGGWCLDVLAGVLSGGDVRRDALRSAGRYDPASGVVAPASGLRRDGNAGNARDARPHPRPRRGQVATRTGLEVAVMRRF